MFAKIKLFEISIHTKIDSEERIVARGKLQEHKYRTYQTYVIT